MGYTFGQEGGTTYGLVDWNDIFSPATTIPWDDILQDLDTVICRMPYTIVNDGGGTVNMVAHRLLTNYKIYGYNHWFGDGIALALNVSTHNFIPGEPCLISTDSAGTGSGLINVRACIEKVSSSPGVNDLSLGIVLETTAAYNDEDFSANYTSVIVSGVTPALRDNTSSTVEYGEPLFYDTDNVGALPFSRGVCITQANAAGQVGRVLSRDTDIPISATEQWTGCTALLFNKAELY